MEKCPRCELNYKDEKEPYCPVCTKEMSRKDDGGELDVCIICGSPNIIYGLNICESCLNKKGLDDDLEKPEELETSIDGYSDLIDTDIPDCDLTIGDGMDEYDEQDDFEDE